MRSRQENKGAGSGRAAVPVRLGRSAALLVAALLVAALLLAGCGGSPEERRSAEELLAEKALTAAMAGENAAFMSLVDPSFLESSRSQMPDIDDEGLGGILIAGFLADIPYRGVKEASYDVDSGGDEAVVHVWGIFLTPAGEEVEVGEAEALRVPLVRVGGRWYLDLLDL